ncbi:MAG: DNA polymerase III subunit delta [Bacteroidetes bacterium 4572_77]|nr:MAG: DNA polymerase III subunit delta [Bacteroidetes bacterium 4572_77]
MQFKNIIGQEEIKKRLLESVHNGRISHAQMFLGKGVNGKFALAVAYAQYINCPNRSQSDSCGTCPSCKKYAAMSHPDLFFSFPVNTTKTSIKEDEESKGDTRNNPSKSAKAKDLISTMFTRYWLDYLNKNNYYPELQSWYKKIEIDNKQGIINVAEARRIIKDLGFKPSEAHYKVLIMWQPEKMNVQAANLLLKFFEEPPPNTLIILVADEKDQLLPTIQSRFQTINIPKISDSKLSAHLKEYDDVLNETEIYDIVKLANGDLHKAQSLIDDRDSLDEHFTMFASWMRSCVKTGSLEELKAFVENIARIGRENQKDFLNYSLRMLRESLLSNYGHPSLQRLTKDEAAFLVRFHPFVHVNNRLMIEKIDKAIMEIGRNANATILFMKLSLDISQLIKMKQ